MLKSFAQDLSSPAPEISPGVGICERRLRQAETARGAAVRRITPRSAQAQVGPTDARRGILAQGRKLPARGDYWQYVPPTAYSAVTARARRSRRFRGSPQIVSLGIDATGLRGARRCWAKRARSRPIRNLFRVRSIQNHYRSTTGTKPRAGFTARVITICATARPARCRRLLRRKGCGHDCALALRVANYVSSPSSAGDRRDKEEEQKNDPNVEEESQPRSGERFSLTLKRCHDPGSGGVPQGHRRAEEQHGYNNSNGEHAQKQIAPEE